MAIEKVLTSMIEGTIGGGGVKNYIKNGNAETDTAGWAKYLEEEAVTLTAATLRVTLAGHGLTTSDMVSFSSLGAGIPGIADNTLFWVTEPTTNDFRLGTSQNSAPTVFYVDGAGTMVRNKPKLGVGGSPGANIAITRSIVDPLADIASFDLEKTLAVNAMGSGYSYDFLIDNKDKAKVLEVSFSGIVKSGAFLAGFNQDNYSLNESTLTVWIYDVTNSKMIQPSSYKILSNSTTLANRFSATFQSASNSNSYRLILHYAQPTTTAITYKIDEVTVTPSVYVYGTPITDWMPYPSLITGCSATSVQFFYRRVGDSIDIKGNFIASSPNGSIATFSLPPGLTASAAKYGTVTGDYAGFGTKNNSSTNTRKRFSLQAVSGGNFIYYGSDDYAAGVSPGSTVTGSSIWNSGEAQAVFYHSLPVTGWSSSIQMSDQADTRIVAAKYKFSGGKNVSSTLPYNFDTLVYDTHGAVTTSSTAWKFTAPVSGLYRLSVLTSSPGTVVTTYVYKNGASFEGMNTGTFVLNNGSVTSTTAIQLNVGEYIDIRIDNTISGVAAGVFSIERISGPQAIAASETIAMRATNASGQSVSTGANAVLTGWVKDFDTHGAFNASTGIFTVPAAGYYRISVLITPLSKTYSIDGAKYHALSIPAVTTLALVGVQGTSNATYLIMQGSTLAYFNAGSTISLLWDNNSGTNGSLLTSSSSNWITIERIK